VVNDLVKRLNRQGKDRIAAMWEVAVFHGLAQRGTLLTEQPLPSGRKPDIAFSGSGISFIADITSVSNDGVNADNPTMELSAAIEKAKGKLGLPIGGMNLRISSVQKKTNRGVKTVLRLPHEKQIQRFVNEQIVPQLKDQIRAGQTVLSLEIDSEVAGLSLTIDSSRGHYNSVGFASFDGPTIIDRNPLYSALKAKASQLRGAEGRVGIIVGDADSTPLKKLTSATHGVIPAGEIAYEFLRQHSSIDFVLLLTITEKQRATFEPRPASRNITPLLVVRNIDDASRRLEAFFADIIADMPSPVMMPINAALRARESGYDLGFHGGYRVSGDIVRMSSRELVETLAGLRRLDDNGAKYVNEARKRPQRPSALQGAFLRMLREGRLPAAIRVVDGTEDEPDDWIEIEFGDPDPAITRFR
jgi:hypothetical protein